MFLIFGENLGLTFSSHSPLESSCPLSVLSWLWMNLSLTVGWLFNSWPMVIWDDLFPNFTDGILDSLKIVCFWDYSKWSGHMLVLSLFLFLLPENKLGQGPFHLIIRTISFLCVHELEPYNKLTRLSQSGSLCLPASGSFRKTEILLCHQPTE